MPRTALMVVAVIAALAAPATASAADKYSGKTKQKRPVTFKVRGGKATGTVEQNTSTYFASTGTFDTCNGSAKWTAKRR